MEDLFVGFLPELALSLALSFSCSVVPLKAQSESEETRLEHHRRSLACMCGCAIWNTDGSPPPPKINNPRTNSHQQLAQQYVRCMGLLSDASKDLFVRSGLFTNLLCRIMQFQKPTFLGRA